MNRRAFLTASLAAPVALAAAPRAVLAATRGGAAVALVTADLESHIVAVELASGRVVKRIPTAAGPRSIESSAFRTLVVAHTAHGRLTLLDAPTLSVLGEVAGFGEPRYTALHPTELLAYVTDSKRQEVVTVDLLRRAVVHRTRVPGPARHVSLSGDASMLWTALGSKADRLAVLDLANPVRPRLVRAIAPPFLAHDVVFAPDDRHVWVTSGARSAIAVYARGAASPMRLVAAGAPPQHIAFAEERAYVASGDEGTVRIHRLDGTLVRTTRVPVDSFNITFGSSGTTFGQPTAVTPSLTRGSVCLLNPSGSVRTVKQIARSAHDACIVAAG
jgi:hypothetical protein